MVWKREIVWEGGMVWDEWKKKIHGSSRRDGLNGLQRMKIKLSNSLTKKKKCLLIS